MIFKKEKVVFQSISNDAMNLLTVRKETIVPLTCFVQSNELLFV